PDIKSIQELVGKRIAVDSLGVFSHTVTEAILQHHGVNPGDVTFTAMGSTPLRLAALQSNVVQATMLGVPQNFFAEDAGFSRLVSAQDVINLPQTGLSTLEDNVILNRDVAYRVIKGSLKGLLYYRAHKGASVDLLARFLNIRDMGLAERVYNYSLKVFT